MHSEQNTWKHLVSTVSFLRVLQQGQLSLAWYVFISSSKTSSLLVPHSLFLYRSNLRLRAVVSSWPLRTKNDSFSFCSTSDWTDFCAESNCFSKSCVLSWHSCRVWQLSSACNKQKYFNNYVNTIAVMGNVQTHTHVISEWLLYQRQLLSFHLNHYNHH